MLIQCIRPLYKREKKRVSKKVDEKVGKKNDAKGSWNYQRIALSIVAARFPQLEQVARTRIAAVIGVEQLEQLVITLGSACDEKDAYEAFLAYKPDESAD